VDNNLTGNAIPGSPDDDDHNRFFACSQSHFITTVSVVLGNMLMNT
jgi:hypothetical protein